MTDKELAIYIGSKIKEFRLQRSLTQKELAALVDMGDTTIANYEKGFRTPKKNTLFKISAALNVTIDDLFPPINKDTSTTLQAIQSVSERLSESRRVIVLDTAQKQLDEQEREEKEVSEPVYLYDVNLVSKTAAASGFGRGFGYDDSDRETVQVDERPPRHDIATRVSGDSMEPAYHDGDILYLVDKGLTTYNGELAVIAYGDRSYFKKIYTEKGHLRLVSLNDKYQDIILDFPPAEDTHIKIFAVVGRYGKELDKN